MTDQATSQAAAEVRLVQPFADILERGTQQCPQVIFDVGANLGQTSEIYATTFPEARIFAFEPVPETHEAASVRLARFPGVKLFQLAVSDLAGTVRMTARGRSASNHITDQAVSRWVKEIDAIRLDAFCDRHEVPQVDFLKIDTEGHDLRVLRGCGDLLRRVHFVQVEAGLNRSNPLHVPLSELEQFLTTQGFELFGFYAQKMARDAPILSRVDAVFRNKGFAA